MESFLVEYRSGEAQQKISEAADQPQKTAKHIFFETLNAQLDRFAPLPSDAIFFGVARDDGMPVLLSFAEPSLGSILISGSVSTGKTTLLQAIAVGVVHMYKPQEVQFAVITSNYLEWAEWADLPACGGIFSSEKVHFEKMIDALSEWMQRPDCSQTLLLFLDGVNAFQDLSMEARARLQQLLAAGSFFNIWPIATADDEELMELGEWRKYFRKHVMSTAKRSASPLEQEFIVKEDDAWCRFSILG